MISIKNEEQLGYMRESAKILSDVFKLMEDNVREGISTKRLDKLAYDFIIKCGAKPSFLGYNGFPATLCTSIDEQVVHGIPSSRTLKKGEIIGIDCGVYFKGYHSDAARTYSIGDISQEKQRLIDVTQESFFKGIENIKAGSRLQDIGSQVQCYVESNGMSVVRALVGHGIGKELHEDPSVPNYGKFGRGIRLKAGMTIAIEPMVNLGTELVDVADDGWTVSTKDRKASAHYENTVIILNDGVEIITAQE